MKAYITFKKNKDILTLSILLYQNYKYIFHRLLKEKRDLEIIKKIS